MVKPKLLYRAGIVAAVSIWLLIAGVVGAWIANVTLTALGGVLQLDKLSDNLYVTVGGVLYYVVVAAIFIGIPWLILHRTEGSIMRLLGSDRFLSWFDIGVSLAGVVLYFIAAIIVTMGVAVLFPSIDLVQEQDVGVSNPYGFELAVTFLLFVVIAPFVEEVIFRGYFYGLLRKYGVSIVVATVVVSVLFGAAHGQWNVAINVGVLSVFMCLAREITGSIWPSILMHMMKNGIAFWLLYIAPSILL